MRIRAPRVNYKRVNEQARERERFGSRVLPAYARRSPKVTDVLPVLYLRGLSAWNLWIHRRHQNKEASPH